MKYQKFFPEGWYVDKKNIGENVLNDAIKTQETLEAKVENCDDNYNLYVKFDDNRFGIIKRNEIETNTGDSLENFKTNVSTSKVNKYVQFKVKGIDESNNYILSRKDVENEAMSWIKDEVSEGNILKGIVKSMDPAV